VSHFMKGLAFHDSCPARPCCLIGWAELRWAGK
jgi:hypothetical protein